MKSPRSMIRMRAWESASACAIVPPPAPLPMMTTSNGGIDPVHQLLVLDRPFEAHFRLAAVQDRLVEIPIHRLVPTDVPDPWNDDTRQPPATDEHEGAIRLEGDDAIPAEDLGQPHSSE